LAGKSNGGINRVLGFIVFILIVIAIVAVFYKTKQPKFGEDMMMFAQDLSAAEATYPYIGNMDTQIYYRSRDSRVKEIPVDKRVYFADEKTAKEYNYELSP
jgi:hypothetical protein